MSGYQGSPDKDYIDDLLSHTSSPSLASTLCSTVPPTSGGGGGGRMGANNEPQRSQSMDAGKIKRPQLFHSVSIIVEPVLDDDSVTEPLVLTPTTDVKVTAPREDSPIQPSPQSPILDYDDFIFESRRKKSQEEEEIVQSIIANARLRKEEFARLLQEHADLVNEINRAETTLL
ncbi:uncharacterized protein LOC141848963 [Brevipalpus obovatus]|uniref:uncharacterized protein LOC141848963 n=1 Tax=Brevipalpus obovatus TaxID=246614 RepID=UPI003D9F9497